MGWFSINAVNDFFQMIQPFMLTPERYREKKGFISKMQVENKGEESCITEIQQETPLPLNPEEPIGIYSPPFSEKKTRFIKTTNVNNSDIKSKLDIIPKVYVSKNKDDPLFWCLYVAKYGGTNDGKCPFHNMEFGQDVFETISGGLTFTNQMIKEKKEIVAYIQQNMSEIKMYVKKQKITLQQLQEIMADILSNMKTTIHMCYLWAHYYKYSICFVNLSKKFYILQKVSEEEKHEESDNSISRVSSLPVVISFERVKETDTNFKLYKTSDIWKSIEKDCVYLKTLYKLDSLSSYKVSDLIGIANKWGIDNPQSFKKTELYEKLKEHLLGS